MTLSATHDPTSAYEALAPFYDAYTHSYDYERWLANLEAIALDAGLRGRRLLDVACGTGKSFMPMLERGYEVVACDLSPAMAARARRRSGLNPADVLVADMRELPRLGTFDLATCLDDSLNYLLSEEDLEQALSGIARNLRPGGILIFDLNSIVVYERLFARDRTLEIEDTVFCWRGTGDPAVAPGARCEATLEIFSPGESDGCWTRTTSRHVQRHHEPRRVHAILARTGFQPIELYGQVTGDKLERPGDERRHLKLVYFCRRVEAVPPAEAERR